MACMLDAICGRKKPSGAQNTLTVMERDATMAKMPAFAFDWALFLKAL